MQQLFQNTFHITAFEASELHQKSTMLSEAFTTMRNAYKTDYLIESRDVFEKQKANRKKTGIRKLAGLVATRLSSDAKGMWRAHKATQVAYKELEAVCKAHNIEGDIEEVITTTFELRSKNSDLLVADSVIEGRRVFETLKREWVLQVELGFSNA